MDAIKLLFSGIIFSISSLFSQPSMDAPTQTTSPVRAMRPSSIAYPFSSSTNTESRFRATTTERAAGTHISKTKQQVGAKSTSTREVSQKKVALPTALTSSPSVSPPQTASSSTFHTLPMQNSSGASQGPIPLTDDPNVPLPDTGNPCDILDEGAVCTLNGISGTCQIYGEAITCTP